MFGMQMIIWIFCVAHLGCPSQIVYDIQYLKFLIIIVFLLVDFGNSISLLSRDISATIALCIYPLKFKN